MITVSFTEFRNNASALFTSVERGETIHVMRHGKEIAEISSINKARKDQPSWRKKRIKLTLQGKDISKVMIEERENIL